MKFTDKRENQGYIITDSIRIGEAEFVVGELPIAPAPFVTWECRNGSDYFWGHYFYDEQGQYVKPQQRKRER